MADTWLMYFDGPDKDMTFWVRMQTTGPQVARAHHCGGVVHRHFLVYSGQDESFLTVNSVCSLQLDTAVWFDLELKHKLIPRIDAAAATCEGLGIVIFGGVGIDFEFEEQI